MGGGDDMSMRMQASYQSESPTESSTAMECEGTQEWDGHAHAIGVEAERLPESFHSEIGKNRVVQSTLFRILVRKHGAFSCPCVYRWLKAQSRSAAKRCSAWRNASRCTARRVSWRLASSTKWPCSAADTVGTGSSSNMGNVRPSVFAPRARFRRRFS